MCGISFYVSNKNEFRECLKSSLELTKHRGPDHSGTDFYNIDEYFIGLGHNRLSIIDTSEAGNQPMIKQQLSIVFNGEIFNFKQIKQELEDKGLEFSSHSDTEVILAAYQAYGVSCFGMLKGMFAFALLDLKTNKFFVVRDSVGIKPVYLYQDENSIFGCSEIKGLKAYKQVDTSISHKNIYEFFNTGFLYEPETGYEHISKLMPGSYLEVNLIDNGSKIVSYANKSSSNESELKTLVEDAVRSQEVADVPLGIFFSGGADSSILATLSKNSRLLFAKYSDDSNSDIDLKYSEKISSHLGKNLDVTSIEMDEFDVESILDSFDYVAEFSEELISDYTFWSTYKLSEAARNSGYTVMLSGMGGDEVFAGYPRYLLLKFHKLVKLASLPIMFAMKFKLFPKSFNKKIERLLSYSQESDWHISYSRLLGYFSTKELNSLFHNNHQLHQEYIKKLHKVASTFGGNKNDKVKLAQHMDLTGFLSHNLVVSDKASMLASIELRVPLLDEAIVAYGLKQPGKSLVQGRITKSPLKNLLSFLLPQNLVERPKTGFNPPLDGLINKIGKERVLTELNILSDYLNGSTILEIVEEHFNGNANNTYKIWQLLYFSRWMKHNYL